MSAVSSLYRQAPSEWAGSPDERLVRLKSALRRLTARYGAAEVEARIRRHDPLTTEELILKQVLLEHVQ
jgi:hypothetical protein